MTVIKLSFRLAMRAGLLERQVPAELWKKLWKAGAALFPRNIQRSQEFGEASPTIH